MDKTAWKSISLLRLFFFAFVLAGAGCSSAARVSGKAGCLAGNCFNGQGVYLYPNGAKYTGSFRYGNPEGKGTLVYTDGTGEYKGDFVKGFRYGNGINRFPNGDVYEGAFYYNVPNGMGVYIYADGTVERGEFNNYLFAGPIYLPGGTDESKVQIGKVSRVKAPSYEVDISVNQGSGLKVLRMNQKVFLEVKGVMAALQVMFPRGTSASCRMIGQTQKYIGDVERGMAVYEMISGLNKGNDTFLFPNGNKYVGEHTGNRMQGKGEFLWTNGNRYVGEFRNGMRHGKGTIHWYHGQTYTGDWKNGKLDGSGVYRYKDGSWYEGEFRNGRIEGYGTKFYSNGKVMFKGRWKNWDYVGK